MLSSTIVPRFASSNLIYHVKESVHIFEYIYIYMELLIPKDGESIIDEYGRLWHKYTEKFGPKVMIFMQVGGFYEVYQWTEKGRKIGNSDKASELFGWQLGRKAMSRKHANAPLGSKRTPYMTGCPDYRFNDNNDFYVSKALNDGYHVVIIDQKGNKKCKNESRVRRSIRCIISPGTSLDYQENYQNSFLIAIFVENQNLQARHLSDCMLCIGMAAFDVSTGQSFVHEIYSRRGDMTLPLDEAYRFINSYNPKELLLVTKNLRQQQQQQSTKLEQDLIASLELENFNLTVKDLDQDYQEHTKQAYREEILRRVFTNSCPSQEQLGIVESLGLSYLPGILTAYTVGIQWTYEHDHDLVKRLGKPEIWNSEKHLTLTYNALHQLNIVPTATVAKVRRNVNSLYSILNKAKTAPGKRLLKDRMLSPITDPEELRKRYRLVRAATACYKTTQKTLVKVLDIERLFRRICLKRIRPLELAGFIESLEHIQPIYEFVQRKSQLHSLLPSPDCWLKFQNFRQRCQVFDLDVLARTALANGAEESFFRPGLDRRIDELTESIATKKAFIDGFAQRLTEIVQGPSSTRSSNSNSNNTKPPVDMEVDKQGQCFLRTKPWAARYLKTIWTEIRDQTDESKWNKANVLFQDQVDLVRDLEFEMQKSSAKIRSATIRDYSAKIAHEQQLLRKRIFKVYQKILDEFEQNFYETMQTIQLFVAEVDVTLSLARVARENKYCEPKIQDRDASFVAVKAIRHPIIEQVNRNELYIPNDLTIGGDDDDDSIPQTKNGLLLFSVNGAGKSSLMKAIGLNILMAQMGGFVACDRFEFSPFHNIITRISGDDNMFKGQSSFAVEMSEVRTMLRRAGPRTLVLGDEVCRGTNIKDAIGLVAAVVEKLAQKRTNFVFASHYHSISEFKAIRELDNVEFYHLSVRIGDPRRGNEQNQDIIYERKLQKGVGQQNYGIQVATAQGIDQDVIQAAKKFVNEYDGVSNQLVPAKTSRYNRFVYMIECNRCGAKASDIVRLITHHIREQHTADQDGFIEHWDKDSAHNLEILCETCHVEHHQHESKK